MCQRASSQTAPGKLQVGSQVIVCIYNVLVSQFVLLNDLQIGEELLYFLVQK